MKIDGVLVHKDVTEAAVTDAYMAARSSLDSPGFCISCGVQVEGVEPDARKYECENCGFPGVYGAEELLLHFVAPDTLPKLPPLQLEPFNSLAYDIAHDVDFTEKEWIIPAFKTHMLCLCLLKFAAYSVNEAVVGNMCDSWIRAHEFAAGRREKI